MKLAVMHAACRNAERAMLLQADKEERDKLRPECVASYLLAESVNAQPS